MFNLGRIEHLANRLHLDPVLLNEVLDDFDEDPDSLFKELDVYPANPNKKPREVICLRGRWRLVQQRIYQILLLPHLRPTRYSHGGVNRRGPATNARAHLGNVFAYVADISGFYPSISCKRVNKLFLDKSCSPKLAGILTRVCTYDFHLALGLVTSPILANEIFKPIDRRIGDACQKMGIQYSRFVDDITITAMFDLQTSGIGSVIRDIIERHGFSLAESKTDFGRLDEHIAITGVRLKNDHLDASTPYLRELERLLADHESLASDGPFVGPFLTQTQLFGKVHHACFLNPGRRRVLLSRLKRIDWCAAMDVAVNREICRYRERMQVRGGTKPDCREPLYLSAGAKRFRAYSQTPAYDPTIAPFN